jgi:uncharacterized membrane protein (UPF0127 family)
MDKPSQPFSIFYSNSSKSNFFYSIVLILILLLLSSPFLISYGLPQQYSATATIYDISEDDTYTVQLRTSDTFIKRYIGLSYTKSLGQDQGMIFIHSHEKNQAYVMRNMNFPIDLIFINSNGSIVSIYHAQPESPPYEFYEGKGIWVIELPYDWTTKHNISVGDTVTFP